MKRSTSIAKYRLKAINLLSEKDYTFSEIKQRLKLNSADIWKLLTSLEKDELIQSFWICSSINGDKTRFHRIFTVDRY